MTQCLRAVVVLTLSLTLAGAAEAQRHELAVLGGGQISFNRDSNIGTGFALQGNYGLRLAQAPAVALYIELPVVAGFDINSQLPDQVAQRNYSSLFFTPSLKLKFVPGLPSSPFVSVGGGWARFRMDQPAGSTAPSEVTNSVIQFGAGTEFKVAPFLSIRLEGRDFVSGSLREFGEAFSTGRQHNVVVSGGLVFRL